MNVGAALSSSCRPVFLLGVGRCGSTYQQVQLSRLADLWIWGEHDGVLAGLFAWGNELRTNNRLSKFSYNQTHRDPALVQSEAAKGNATAVAWLNGFGPDDIGDVERRVIAELMERGLPPGKTRWGFKEIRYGPHDRVPERLLELYPDARIVHTLRDPYLTIESAMFAWNFKGLQRAATEADGAWMDKAYARLATRWERVTRYYLDLEAAHPDRVRTSRIEKFADEFNDLVGFLGSEVPEALKAGEGTINASRRTSEREAATAAKLAKRRSRFAGLLAETAARAGYGNPDELRR